LSRAAAAIDAVRSSIRPYLEKEALAALLLGISSGFPYAMIAATLSTRLAQDGLDKKTVTYFALAFLVYNFKVFWAWLVDAIAIPGLSHLGQRRSWLIVSALLVVITVCFLGFVDPKTDLVLAGVAAVAVGAAGATFDIVIDAYRIETLKPHQLGVGAGMSQYGWRIGAAIAAALALLLAQHFGWKIAYVACVGLVLPALFAAWMCGEPIRRIVHIERRSVAQVFHGIYQPFVEFFARKGAVLVIAFVLLHKIGDTVANLTLRLLFNDLGFSNAEIAVYDVGIGFWAIMLGIFCGGILYTKVKLRHGVMIALVLMAVSNLSFAGLAVLGRSNLALAAAMGFEQFASGVGGVVLVAYFSALCDLRFTATQYALISAAASILGRLLTGTQAGALIKFIGYENFYLITTLLAVPGIVLFYVMARTGVVDEAEAKASRRI
jgi:MFS transporter, PAT family, beta-lactamase induction signal transducer AmpG